MSENSHFNSALAAVPAPLVESTTIAYQRVVECQGEEAVSTIPARLQDELARALACSNFIGLALSADSGSLAWLGGDANLDTARSESEVRAMIDAQASAAGQDLEMLMTGLRQLRRREWVRLAWRDLCRDAPLEEIVSTLSWFADAAVAASVGFIDAELEPRFGQPTDASGGPCPGLVVIAMGKLGGFELNFSSDIDVIFCHHEDGETTGGQRQISNQQYAINAAQRLIKILGEQTADGFVFRTDARLRPNGDSGPMSLSFDAMEHYYQIHGREWERYALIKARILAGDGDALLKRLMPFVYRKYLDFGAFASIRDLHGRIERELNEAQSKNDIKRGYGGIRQSEFIVQSFQLMRGGRERRLRTPSLTTALAELVNLDQMEADAAQQLLADYTFLRRVEHRLQMVDDGQTHSLPADDDDKARARLAYAMNATSVGHFEATLDAVRDRISASFVATFGIDRGDDALPGGRHWFEVPTDSEDEFDRLLLRFHDGSSWRNLSSEGRDRLNRLMPMVIEQCRERSDPVRLLSRVIRVFESIGRRSTYFAMLYEYPGVLNRLISLCAASPQLAEMLGRQPVLFDELLQPKINNDADLKPKLAGIADGTMDLEQAMTELREFKNIRFFQIANERQADRIDHTEESLALTRLAEEVVATVETVVRTEMAERLPPALHDNAAFMTVAYGKLGSFELGYASDLDIVFLYDEGDAFDAELSHQAGRFAQRMISLMTTRLASGLLYEIDTQLRPSGRSGTLVASFNAFVKYQQKDAWTFEHQALVRARAITGAEHLRQRFGAERRKILSIRRDPETLRQDIITMRKRISDQRDKSDATKIDLKFGDGALVDIEFIVQYLVLAHAADQPTLLDSASTTTLIERLGETGVLKLDDATLLGAAYDALLNRANALRFMQEPALILRDEVSSVTQGVLAARDRIFNA